MTTPEPTTKGTILRSLLKFVKEDLSPEQLTQAMASLPDADRLIVQKTILASDKISEFMLNRLTACAATAKGEALDAFGRRAGRAEIADAVGVYRFLTVVLTPAALLHKASSLWSTVHSHGELLVENESAGSARIRLLAFPSEEAHCARLTGWFEGAALMTRSKNPRVVHGVCVTRGG